MIESDSNKAKNKTIHPANCAGKEIPFAMKTFFTRRSTNAIAIEPATASVGKVRPPPDDDDFTVVGAFLEAAAAGAFLGAVTAFLLIFTAAPPLGVVDTDVAE